jgi:TonB-dependent starch-binding outer membrane protein SusC
LDFSLLDFKLTGSVDYFIRNTTNLLNTINVPSPPNLFGTSLVNLGEMKTTGLEFALNYKAITKSDFSWTVGVNYSSYQTTLVKYNNQEKSLLYQGNIGAPGLNNTFIVKVADGEQIGQIVAPRFVRYDNTGAAVLLDKDGKETLVRDSKDFVTVGNGLPTFSMGLNNTFTYKNFDLNIFLRGVFGHSLANINRAYFEHPTNTGKGNIVITDKFDPADKQTEAWHSGYVESASFVRLDNATLGYNFKLGESSAARKIRLYVTGQNLFTVTSYTGSDPEVRYYDVGPITEGNSSSTYAGNILAPGIDNRVTYFPTRTYTVGLNVTF